MSAETIIILILSAVIVLLLAVTTTFTRTRNQGLRQEIARLQDSLSQLQQESALKQQEIMQLTATQAQSRQENSGLTDTLKHKEEQLDKLQQEAESLRERLQQAEVALAKVNSEKEALQQMRLKDQELQQRSQEELTLRLQTLGEQMLQSRSESLQKSNSEQMSGIVQPLTRELAVFRQLLTETQKQNSEQSGQLNNELKHLQEAQVTLGRQAEQLTFALMQGNKTQGIWGELQLEHTLEAAGLEKNVTYFREVTAENESGARGRADVIVTLPGRRGIVIDAKCSLVAYTEYISAEHNQDEKAAQAALKRHLDSVIKHIDELSTKNYPQFAAYGSPDFVMMFVPIDNALGLALKARNDLYVYAQHKNIYLTSPLSLLPALRLVGNLWLLSQQSEKFSRLAQMAERIYQKGEKVSRDFDAIIKANDTLNQCISQFGTSFQDGRGNLRKLLGNFAASAPALTESALSALARDNATPASTPILPATRSTPDMPAALTVPADSARLSVPAAR